jgi:hypothetical protein
MRHPESTALAALALILLTACASAKPAGSEGPVVGAVEQPFRDLNVIQDDAPPVIALAAQHPYAAPTPADCSQIGQGIEDLNRILGPDVDSDDAAGRKDASALVGEALRGAVHLPFRGVVRKLSGAAEHDRQLALAVTAAVARRGFLRGLAQSQGCALPTPSDLKSPD